MTDLDEHLPAIAAGDPEAFGRWVAGAELRLRASLQSFAAQVDTESIVQECLLRVWQVAPRVRSDGRGDSLLRMAIRIARNLAISELRRHRQEPVLSEELERLLNGASDHLPASAAGGPPTDPFLRRILERCRKELPRRPAQALEARLASRGGKPDQVLAEGLGMRLNTFLQNFTRARRFLADCLRRHGIDLEAHLR